MKKLLITGQQGIIGSIISTPLRNMGYEVDGYDIKSGDDILNTDKLTERLKGKDACIHLAAIPGPTLDPWEEFERINVNGTLSVIKACKKAGVKRMIYMSSGDTYGLCGQLTLPGQFPIKEDGNSFKSEDPCLYAKSKRICEKHLEEAVNKNFTAIALRLETPYPAASIIPEHFFISISYENLVEAIRAALESDFKGFGVFNIGDREIHSSISDEQIASLKRQYNVPDYAVGRQSLYDISKAISALGYNPQ
jgi:nucleoside-diphosphate-sugar epimerase